jgi:predicted RNase H-like nuclease (RuvC/YqgF family)
MKNTIIAASLLVLTTASSFAETNDRRPRRGNNDRVDCRTRVQNLNQRIQSLSFENQNLSDANANLSNSLFQCQQTRSSGDDTAKVRRLRKKLKAKNAELADANMIIATSVTEINDMADKIDRKNQRISDMSAKIDRKNQKISNLKMKIAQLEDELNPTQPYFNLADSVRACSGINHSSYAKDCTSHARTYEIHASVIEACTEISNAYYAAECVKLAGKNNGYAAQVQACIKIDHASYATQCVQDATAGDVAAEVISSCVATSNNAYYQADCVKSMAN